jgi:hypothetical protein
MKYHNMWNASDVESPPVGERVHNTYGDSGEVVKVTINWVLVRPDDAEVRWVHRERFEDGTWAVSEW